MNQTFLIICALAWLHATPVMAQDQSASVHVRAADQPVEKAEVRIAGVTHYTDASGTVTITVGPGNVEMTITKTGYVTAAATVQVSAGTKQDITVDLQREPTLEETVDVVATTRTEKRLEDRETAGGVGPRVGTDPRITRHPMNKVKQKRKKKG